MSNLDFHSKPLAELRNSYWMIQKLGVGGFGKVYLIRHRESREFRAAKHQKWTSSDVPKLIRNVRETFLSYSRGKKNWLGLADTQNWVL